MRHDIGAPQRAISLMPSSDPRELFADPLLSSLGGGHQEENIISGGDKVRVIWGTNIVIQETVKQFKDFLLNFTEAHLVLANGGMANDEANLWEPYYPKLLKRLYETGQNYMNLDGRHLKAFRGTRILFDQLIKYPQEIIPLMDLTVNEVFSNLAGSVNLNNNLTMLQVRPFQMDRHVNLREMSPSEVDQLITLKGLVIRSTSILPDMRTGFFQCSQCAHVMTVDNIKGVLAEPQACPRIGCGAHH